MIAAENKHLLGRAALAALVVSISLGIASPAFASSPRVSELPMDETHLGPRLAAMIDARAAGDQRAFDMLVANGLAVFEGPLAEVQLHVAKGVDPDVFPDALFAAFGGRAGVRGIDMMNAWLPLERVQALLHADRRLVFAQLPWRPRLLGAPIVGEGAKILRDPRLSCLGADGSGVTVAVIDQGFEKLKQVQAKGEIKHLIGQVKEAYGTHGTMCAEVVADVAPEATILPVQVESFSALEGFFKKLSQTGNPDNVRVISHSVIWLGMSFGRSTGKACEMVNYARSLGIAWVNAAGNSGHGYFYTAPYRDEDGDGRHDFGPGEKMLRWRQYGGQIKLWIDWDDYTLHKMDLDAFLYRQVQGEWKLVAQSTLKNGVLVPPIETIEIKKAVSGVYGLVLKGGTKMELGTQLRVMEGGYGAGSFSIYHKNGNVYDPGSCDGVLTVGAVHYSKYKTGPLASYSSYGPTPDGRQKPELVAPSSVKTSLGGFAGTSAACPHAAGALALYVQATSTAAPDLIQKLIDDGIPMGPVTPNDAWGWGALRIRPESLGWACDPKEIQGGISCESACGTIGEAQCGLDCRLGVCLPPAEICNADDDDCDGQTDEEQGCVAGRVASCTTSCLSEGERRCDGACTWGLCQPPAESCNAADDDCDGQTDEDFACMQGAIGPCQTACGSEGSRRCSESCSWSICEPPSERCNGSDDDCDGLIDEGLKDCDPEAGDEGWWGGCAVDLRQNSSASPLVLLSLLLALALLIALRRRSA